jgi:hypothetical protein
MNSNIARRGAMTASSVCVLAMLAVPIDAGPQAAASAAGPQDTLLDEGQRLFFSARYDAAAELMSAPCQEDQAAACEVRASALLFRMRRELGEAAGKKKALEGCATCAELLSGFQRATERGRRVVKAELVTRPEDEEVLFLVSKLALNHVWLELGVLGHKTGWNEYWEARKTLDRLLQQNPGHVRGRVARAWIDYIVDTKMPRGTRWLLGGGNKKRGLATVREAAAADAPFFARAEARFALWDMQVRERLIGEAVVTARDLTRDFPDNAELQRFVNTYSDAPVAASRQRLAPNAPAERDR